MISKLLRTPSIYTDNQDTLLFWQRKIFKALFICLLLIGSIPYALSCKYAIETQEWHRVVFYSGIYVWGILVTFADAIPFRLRAWGGLSGFYLLGVFSLLSSGFVGSTRLYLLCFSAFAAIFSGMGAGLFAIGVNLLTLVGVGFAFFNHGLPLGGEMLPVEPMLWVVLCGTFSFLSTALTLALSVLIKALEVSGREFRTLIKNTSDIIWTADRQMDITFINSAATQILGFTREELTGRPLAAITGLTDQQLLDWLSQSDAPPLESRTRHRNGTFVDIELTGSAVRYFSGSGHDFQGQIRDISQKKIQEQEEEKIREKQAQLEKLKMLGILAGSVAHDLNNTLSGIATYPEILMMNDQLDPETRKGLSIIRDTGQKASAVVSDLLTVSRGSSAEMEIININDVIERYTDAPDFKEIQQQFPQVTVDFLLEPELLNIQGSYIHLEKIIMNLILNGVEEVDARKNGTVHVFTENSYFDASMPGHESVEPGEYVVLQVRDNGSGIDPAFVKKIFDPFFTQKEMGKSGTGLGLTVVWNAVQDHGGYIFVHSDSSGTRFELLFPAIRQPVAPRKEDVSFEEIRGQGEFILVVDDLIEQQNIALTILDSLGYRAKAVNTGQEAVSFIKSQPVDLVILDMIMAPSISGLETYRRIKEISPGQKAVIASGYAVSEDVTQAQAIGAGSFVKKPYTVLEMGIAIKEELEK